MKSSAKTSDTTSATLAYQNFSAWMIQQIQASENLLALDTEIAQLHQQFVAASISFSTTLGVTRDHFDALMRDTVSARGKLMHLLFNITVEYLKQKNSTKLTLTEVFDRHTAEFNTLIAQIATLDDTVRLKHAAQVRTYADAMNDFGFIPEKNVPELKLTPHIMSERDMEHALYDLSGRPIITQETKDNFEVTIVLRPLDLSVGTHILEADIRRAEKELATKATKVTLLYPANDGKSHYEFLQVSVDRQHHYSLTLENSLPRPGTTDTATHHVFKAASDVLEKVASDSKDSKVQTDLKFTGQQNDAVSCSFFTIQRIVNQSVPVKMDPAAASYKDIANSKQLDDLKLRVTQRLVNPTIAAELKVDPVTHVVYRAEEKLDAKQKSRLDAYKAAHIARQAEKADLSSSEQKLRPNVKDDGVLAQNAKVLQVLTNKEIQLNTDLNAASHDRRMDYAKLAVTIYDDKKQVDAYKKILNACMADLKKEEKSVQNSLDSLESVSTTISSNIDLLVTKSDASVDAARKAKKDITIDAKKAEADAYAAVEAVKKADDAKAAKKAEETARKAMGYAHEQHTLQGTQFKAVENKDYTAAKAKHDAAKHQQELEDEKLARILQNQDVLDRFFRPAKQISDDEALARQLQAEEDKKMTKKS